MCQALEGYEPHPNRLRCRAHQAEEGQTVSANGSRPEQQGSITPGSGLRGPRSRSRYWAVLHA